MSTEVTGDKSNLKMSSRREILLGGATFVAASGLGSSAAPAQDAGSQLASWNEGPAKRAIDQAKKDGWIVISVNNDWKRIFAFV